MVVSGEWWSGLTVPSSAAVTEVVDGPSRTVPPDGEDTLQTPVSPLVSSPKYKDPIFLFVRVCRRLDGPRPFGTPRDTWSSHRDLIIRLRPGVEGVKGEDTPNLTRELVDDFHVKESKRLTLNRVCYEKKLSTEISVARVGVSYSAQDITIENRIVGPP